MKLWASAPLIGLSVAFAAAACSSSPSNDNTYTPPSGGTGTAAGTSGTAGTPAAGGSGTSGSTTGGSATGGSATGGSTTGGSTTGGSTTSGTGGVTAGGTGGVATGGGGSSAGGGAEIPCPANVLGHCSEATYPAVTGYTLALVEDFPAPIDLDADPIMTWSDGSPGDGQTDFRKEQIGFANGHMIITAQPPDGCAASTTNPTCIPPRPTVYGEAEAPNATASIKAMGVWSGELRSKYNNYRYGHYEAKYKAPLANPAQATQSNMSGFLSTMFIFRFPKNVVWNEIDVELEPNKITHYQGNMISHSFAMPYAPGKGYNDVSGDAHVVDVAGPAGYDISQEHVYAFNWTPTKVEWFLDGTSVHVETAGIPKLSAKIMMNLWFLSGNAFGPNSMNQYPIKAEYDYFRFYKLDGADEPKYPCTPVPTCLDPADKMTSAQNNPTEKNYGQ